MIVDIHQPTKPPIHQLLQIHKVLTNNSETMKQTIEPTFHDVFVNLKKYNKSNNYIQTTIKEAQTQPTRKISSYPFVVFADKHTSCFSSITKEIDAKRFNPKTGELTKYALLGVGLIHQNTFEM